MMKFLLIAFALASDLRGTEEYNRVKTGMGGAEKLMSACKMKMSDPTGKLGDGEYSLKATNNGYAIHEGSGGVVTGKFDTPAKGWGNVFMSFKSKKEHPELSDDKKMYGAGFLEGAVTAQQIYAFYTNTAVNDRSELNKLFASQLGFLGEHADAEGKDAESTAFWRQSVAQGCQIIGMTDGYNAVRAHHGLPELVPGDISRLNADGQVQELQDQADSGAFPHGAKEVMNQKAFSKLASIPEHSEYGSFVELASKQTALLKKGRVETPWKKPGRCSAFVKFTGDDVLLGHTTWEDYKEQVRSMKRYDFPLQDSKAKKVMFSSYPGCISSTDDFALTDTGIAITETTTNIENANKQNFLKEGHIPDYMHVMSVLRMATSGKDFVDKFVTPDQGKLKASYLQLDVDPIQMRDVDDANSRALTGSYCSEWMVLDTNKVDQIKDGKLPPETLMIMETAPGVNAHEHSMIQTEFSDDSDSDRTEMGVRSYMTNHGSAFCTDATPRLNNGDKGSMWASYNQPELKQTIEVMGTQDDFDDRSTIFDKHGRSVTNMDEMAWLMRRNNPKVDCVSPSKAIAPRADLGEGFFGHAFGGTDTKLLSAKDAKSMSLLAISGPTAVVNGQCTPYVFPQKLPGIEQKMDAGWQKVSMDKSEPWVGDDGVTRSACFMPTAAQEGRCNADGSLMEE